MEQPLYHNRTMTVNPVHAWQIDYQLFRGNRTLFQSKYGSQFKYLRTVPFGSKYIIWGNQLGLVTSHPAVEINEYPWTSVTAGKETGTCAHTKKHRLAKWNLGPICEAANPKEPEVLLDVEKLRL
jgi:hypothetical protein